MKVIVDSQRCTGHGRCYTLASEVIGYDDEGFPTVRDAEVEFSEDQLAAVQNAVRSCPEDAVRIIPD